MKELGRWELGDRLEKLGDRPCCTKRVSVIKNRRWEAAEVHTTCNCRHFFEPLKKCMCMCMCIQCTKRVTVITNRRLEAIEVDKTCNCRHCLELLKKCAAPRRELHFYEKGARRLGESFIFEQPIFEKHTIPKQFESMKILGILDTFVKNEP